MFRRSLRIADIRLQIVSDRELEITSESEPFLCDAAESADTTAYLRAVDALPRLPDGGVWDSNRYFAGDTVFLCNGESRPPYAMVTYLQNRDIRIDYLPLSGAAVWKTSGLISSLGLERLLLGYDALILHASFISWKRVGILFSAPSGTGKSTQADLWRQHAGADILNGDRACIRKVPEGYLACGMPYAGSSNIYRNEAVPLKAIVVLRQAPENRVRPMRQGEILACLLPELSLHRWDAAFMNKALDFVTDMLGHVPVYLLECLPNADAVNVLREALFEE